jgi:hypothetical protein
MLLLRFFSFIMLYAVAMPTSLFSQLSQGGVPPSWALANKSALNTPRTLQLSTQPDWDFVAWEDAQAATLHKPRRFGVFVPCDISTTNAGTWATLPDGSRLWQVRIASPGAQAVQPLFEAFHLPAGAELFAHTPSGHLAGAFTSRNHTRSGAFAIAPLPSDELTLELRLPAGTTDEPRLHVYSLIHCYRDFDRTRKDFADIGTAGPCNVNAACTEGDNWAPQRDAVVGIGLILPLLGASWCTGTLVNTTAQNYAPYVLTAHHCGLHPFNGTLAPDSLLDQWTFYFDFSAPGCTYSGNPSSIPNQTIVGCSALAHSNDNGGDNGSDFLLLQLNNDIPAAFTPYWAGWNAQDAPAASGVGLHHPAGDLMKISTFGTAPQHEQWGTLDSSHWIVQWVSTPNGHGITEGGSSGSAIFDQNGRIVGTLTGGLSGCDVDEKTDEYGKVAYHWNRNGTQPDRRLHHWLDPTNSGALTQNGTYYTSALPQPASTQPQAICVYPNPTEGALQVILPEGLNVTDYTLTDAAGRTVRFGTLGVGVSAVNLAQPAPGLYALAVTATDGRRFVARVCVQ